ncbi:MAG: hypothetical protein RLY86_3972 [Pseudomonadota bacterium]|jgi:3-deoxy-7-phosphoheptulonate synthase
MSAETASIPPAADSPTVAGRSRRGDTPVVLGMEVEALLAQLPRLVERRAVLLHADLFPEEADWDLDEFEQRLRYVLLLTAILLYKSALPVVKLVTLAGPALPAGDEGEVRALRQTIARRANLLRAYTRGGFADLNNIRRWIPDLDATTPEGRDLKEIVLRIQDTLDFIAACLGGTGAVEHISNAEVFFALPAAVALAIDGEVGAEAGSTTPITAIAHVLTASVAEVAADGDVADFLRRAANPVRLTVPATGADGLVAALRALSTGDRPRVVLDLADRSPGAVAAVKAAVQSVPGVVAGLTSTFHGMPVTLEDGRTDLRVGNRDVEAFCTDPGAGWTGVGLAAGAGGGDFRLAARNRMPGFAYHLIEMLKRGALPVSRRGLTG